MALTDGQAWWIALGFGLVMVLAQSWARFDEPPSDGKTSYFHVYKPRFHTSPTTFKYAKAAYLAIFAIIFFGLCFSPQLINFFIVEKLNVEEAAIPLAVALAISSLQGIPVIRGVERQLRGFLHSTARIPHAVRRTVARMRSAGFEARKSGSGNLLPPRLSAQLRLDEIREYGQRTGVDLLSDDDILRPWYRMTSVLQAMEDRNRSTLNIDPLFLDEFEDELDSIRARHQALLYDVSLHVEKVLDGDMPPESDHTTAENLRRARDRLYTFIACGLLSNLRTQVEVDQELHRLGFMLPGLRSAAYPLWKMIGFSIIVIVIASGITTGITKWYIGQLPDLSGIDWREFFKRNFNTPNSDFGLVLWSWKTAGFHFSAVLAAIIARQSFIAKRQWFDLQERERQRPYFQYVWPSLAGAFSGWAVLSVIIFWDVIGTPVGETPYEAVTLAMQAALQWAPLALVLSIIVLYIADSDIKNHTPARIAGRALASALITGIVGFLILQTFKQEPNVKGILTDAQFALHEDEIRAAAFLFGCLAAMFIALFDFMLCLVVGFVERMRQNRQNFSDKLLMVSNPRGKQFKVRLSKDGSALTFPPDTLSCADEHALCAGDWKQIPEGTVVQWRRQSFEENGAWGDIGIVTLESGSVIYEGYFGNRNINTRSAEFFGQVETFDG